MVSAVGKGLNMTDHYHVSTEKTVFHLCEVFAVKKQANNCVSHVGKRGWAYNRQFTCTYQVQRQELVQDFAPHTDCSCRYGSRGTAHTAASVPVEEHRHTGEELSSQQAHSLAQCKAGSACYPFTLPSMTLPVSLKASSQHDTVLCVA